MNSLLYLTSKIYFNKLKDNIRHPGRMFIYIVIIALMLISLFTSQGGGEIRQREELYALVFGFYSLNFILTFYEGFSSGGTLFTMADINLLFLAPQKPSVNLFYGMLRRLGTSVFFGMAFVYEYPILMKSYSLSFTDFLILLLGFGFTVFISRILSMVLYFFTCGNEKLKSAAKKLLFTIVLIFVFVFLERGNFFYEPSLKALVKGVSSPLTALFPVSGTVLYAVKGFIEAEYLTAALCFAFLISVIVISFFVLSKSKRGYYEDVLETAEKSFSAITSQRETIAMDNAPSKVKSGVLGFKKGEGASVIYQKHKKENKRARKLFLSPSAFLGLIFVLIFSFSAEGNIFIIFVSSIYSMIFTVTSARWSAELTKPFIYMIPENPVKKLFYAILEQVPALFIESAVCLIPLFFIFSIGISDYIFLILARTSFGFTVLGSSLLNYRFYPSREKGKLYMTVTMFIGIFFSMPGLLVIIFGGEFFFLGTFSYLFSLPINLAITLLLLFLSRNLLSRTELN